MTNPKFINGRKIIRDGILNKRILLWQDVEGYRFNLDSILLANFAHIKDGERFADLGCGGGVITILMFYLSYPSEGVGIEIQEPLSEIAMMNIRENNLESQITIMNDDFRTIKAKDIGGLFDLVIANPPYYPLSSGRISKNLEEALSRHEVTCNLTNILESALRLLKKGGRIAIVYPYKRFDYLINEGKKLGLNPVILREVYAMEGLDPYLMLVLLSPSEWKAPVKLPPLYVYSQGGIYSDEVKGYLSGNNLPGTIFLCDCMLGKMAKHLRALGYNVIYFSRAKDDFLISLCRKKGITLLTMDRGLCSLLSGKSHVKDYSFPFYHVPCKDTKSQLSWFFDNFIKIKSAEPRCRLCNIPIITITKEAIKERIPIHVYKTHERFDICPCCARVYWGGSHLLRFNEQMEMVLSENK